MSDYQVTINGYVYFAPENSDAAEALKNANASNIDNILKDYSSQITKAPENEYQTFEEDVDISTQSTDRTNTAKGLDYEQYRAYAQGIGLNSLTEDSSIDDVLAVFKEIENEINELDLRINSLDSKNPNEIDALLNDINILSSSLSNLGDKTGIKLPGVGSYASNAAIGAVALGAGCVAASAIGAKIGGVVGSCLGPLGTVAGIAIGAGLGALIGIAVKQAEKNGIEKKLAELEQKMQAADEKVTQAREEVIKSTEDYVNNEIIKDVESELDGLLNGDFSFDDIKDVSSISKNIDKIIKCQQLLEPWAELCEKYGINIDKLSEYSKTLGTGDSSLDYAQDYVDSYIDQLNVSLEDEVVSDTNSLNAFYQEIYNLGVKAESSGLNTDKIAAFLTKLQEINQQEADNTADDIANGMGAGANTGSYGTSGGTGSSYINDAAQNYSGYQNATQTSQGVQQGSSAYTTSTNALDETAKQLEEATQAAIDNYAKQIQELSNKNIAELEEYYEQVEEDLGSIKKISSELNTSEITKTLEEIREEQQRQADEFAKQMEEKINNSTSTAERLELQAQINKYISDNRELHVQLDNLQKELDTIKQKEQESVNEKATEYNQQISNVVGDINNSGTIINNITNITQIADNITNDINNSQTLNVDVGALQEILLDINLKIDILTKLQEEQEKEQEPPTEESDDNTPPATDVGTGDIIDEECPPEDTLPVPDLGNDMTNRVAEIAEEQAEKAEARAEKAETLASNADSIEEAEKAVDAANRAENAGDMAASQATDAAILSDALTEGQRFDVGYEPTSNTNDIANNTVEIAENIEEIADNTADKAEAAVENITNDAVDNSTETNSAKENPPETTTDSINETIEVVSETIDVASEFITEETVVAETNAEEAVVSEIITEETVVAETYDNNIVQETIDNDVEADVQNFETGTTYEYTTDETVLSDEETEDEDEAIQDEMAEIADEIEEDFEIEVEE